eukprot:2071764-Rhodomonas_salina.2
MTVPALGLDMDEAYELAIPSPLNRESDGRLVATLTAATQVGAYRGLETFSQLVSFDFDEANSAICPRARYEMPGTDIVHYGTRSCTRSAGTGSDLPVCSLRHVRY